MNVLLKPLMTAEEFLALPDEPGVERWLIDGQLRERRHGDGTGGYRDRWEGRPSARFSHVLGNWLDRLPRPRGEVYSGAVGCHLSRNPDTIVGIDAAYFGADVAARQPADTTLLDGPPVLAVEVPSPSERLKEIDEKLERYLASGVALVWVVHPRFETVTVYAPAGPPVLYNNLQEISGDPHLPGFRTPVAALFGR